MNPPRPIWEWVCVDVNQEEALSFVIGAMTHGWSTEILPSKRVGEQNESGTWSVKVFKGEWI